MSCTQSIERSFGAACRAPGLGFLYNGFLRAFKVQNRRHPNYLRLAAGFEPFEAVAGPPATGVAEPRRDGGAAVPDRDPPR